MRRPITQCVHDTINFVNLWRPTCAGLVLLFLLGACAGPAVQPSAPAQEHRKSEPTQFDAEILPELHSVALNAGEHLRVVATTNIIADIVANIGADHIDLIGLIPIGADPHGFTPTPRDLQALNDAHVIFVNGLGLEEPLLPFLGDLNGDVAIVSVNIGVETLVFGKEDHDHDEEAPSEGEHEAEAQTGEHEEAHDQEGADPHTWFSIHNVERWVENTVHVLSELDPANAESYAANAEAYHTELVELETELEAMVAQLPPARRKLVTDHDSFGYFAHEYDFEIIGTVIPALSTLASPSAGDLAALHAQIQVEAVPAIFVGTTVNSDLARQIAVDMGIQIVPVYTGSLSEGDGPAATYLDFMRYDVTTIVEALR